MRVLVLFVALFGLILSVPATTVAESEEATPAKGSIDLKYRTYRKWKFRMPVVAYKPVSGGFDFTAGGGGTFDAALDGQALKVDLDGDGTHDVTIEGDSGVVTFERKDADGNTTFKYAAQLVGGTAGWVYAPAGARVGAIGETKVQLIDMDGNGCYADVGTDAMVVGFSKVATFLSKVTNAGGELVEIKPAKDGATLDFAKYDGPKGRLDLTSGLETNGKVLELVAATPDRRYSFDLTTAPKGGIDVPAGEYVIHKGTLGLGAARVTVIHGRGSPIDVEQDKTTTLAWGGPIRAEFEAAVAGGEVALDPGRLRYFGRAGEQYIGFSPQGKSPEFTIIDGDSRKQIAKAIFTGC